MMKMSDSNRCNYVNNILMAFETVHVTSMISARVPHMGSDVHCY